MSFANSLAVYFQNRKPENNACSLPLDIWWYCFKSFNSLSFIYMWRFSISLWWTLSKTPHLFQNICLSILMLWVWMYV